jgi:hypothetical protein
VVAVPVVVTVVLRLVTLMSPTTPESEETVCGEANYHCRLRLLQNYAPFPSGDSLLLDVSNHVHYQTSTFLNHQIPSSILLAPKIQWLP